jgi:hypothetical protein
MLNLFHGSDVEVQKPLIRPVLRALDFGAGFYCTSSKTQAIKWAKTVAKRRKKQNAILNIYTLNEKNIGALRMLKFETADADWLDFVVTNRTGRLRDGLYDLVIGPVANDSTLPVINDYMDGVYTKEEAVNRLLPQNLTDQYAFLTADALALLSFVGGETL